MSESPLSYLRFTRNTHPSPIRPPLHPSDPPLEHTPLHLLPHAFLPQALTEIHARGVALGEIRYDSMFITDDAKVSCSLATSIITHAPEILMVRRGTTGKALLNC